MSYTNYAKALELAKNCEGYFVEKGKTKDVISTAEKLVGLEFSKQHYDYLNKLGFLDFFGHEFHGIPKDDFSGIPEGCMIKGALHFREKNNLPQKWIPIYNFEDGHMAYLDYSDLNEQGEPRIIEAIYTGEKYEITEVLAEDFGDFLLQQIDEYLSTND
jgi:hypothetical protein